MESAFQFTNPALVSMEYVINDSFENEQNKEVSIQMNINVSTNSNREKNEASVVLKLEIGAKDSSVPFYICARESAGFRWENSLDEELVNKLLKQNAPSLLLSYLRPIIAQITAASPFDTYNIPFVNFTNLKSENSNAT